MHSARSLALVACLAVSVAASPSEIIENLGFKGPKTTISYAMWGGADEVENAKLVGGEFVKRHPEIRLDVSVYPWGQYWAKVQTQTASGLAPDVLSFYSGAFGVWVSRGALLPLDELFKNAGLKREDYHKVAFDNVTWDGKLYAMPMEMPMWSVVYSKDRLEQSGIPKAEWPRPDTAMTWDQFKALAARLTLRKPDGSFLQYGMSAGQNWDMTMMSMHGGFPTDRNVNPTRVTVQGNEKLIRGFIDLFESQYANRWTLGAVPLAAGSFTASSDTLLLSSRFAMGTTGPWALRQLKDGGVRFGVTPMPRSDYPVQLINVNSVGIYSASKHPKEAFELLKFMASPWVQNLYGRHLKGVPVLKSARDSLIHNDYQIEGLEAYLHDLDVSVPALTSSSTDLQNATDKWRQSVEQILDAEYDHQLSLLHRPISQADAKAMAAGMAGFIEATVRSKMPELDKAMQEAFAKMQSPPPTPFVSTVAPLLALLVLAALIGGYLVVVSHSGSRIADEGMKRGNLTGYLFILPWLLGFTFLLIGPILAAVYLSFTDWNMITAPKWVGAQHYLEMPHDPKFLIGLKNTFLYALFVIPISLIGGLTTAGLLTSRIKGSDLFKAIIYFPALFTGAEAAVLWVNMLNKEYGIINYALSWFHIDPINWMDEQHAFYSVVMMNVFWIGGAMLIYYAGMKQIPSTLYEAADLDGASAARKFLKITIPLLSPVILFMVVMTTIGAFQVFTPALFFASDSTQIGTPGDSLRFYSVNIYDTAFNNLKMGLACSYALVLFLLIFAITMVQMRIARRFVYTEGM
jgi:multiple sugar transport system permease protein